MCQLCIMYGNIVSYYSFINKVRYCDETVCKEYILLSDLFSVLIPGLIPFALSIKKKNYFILSELFPDSKSGLQITCETLITF